MPDYRDVQYPEHLRRLSVAYRNAAYVGDEVFPISQVGRRTGWYKSYGREGFRPVNDLREPGSRSRMVDFSVERVTYMLHEYALNQPITDEELEEGQYEFPELEATAVRTLTDRVMLGREKRVASIARDPNVIQQNDTLSGTAQFSDAENSDPYTVAQTARRTIRQAIGRRPNLAVIPYDVMEALKLNAALRSMLPDSRVRILTEDLIRQLFEVDRVVVPEVVEDLGADSDTPALEDVWGNDLLFAFVEPNPGVETLTFGTNFRLRGQQGSQSPVRRWRQDPEKSTFVEVGFTEDPHVVCSEAAYLVQNAIPADWTP